MLGSGWAGYALARTLSPKTTSRILISPRSHFVFTPLLASTSVGTLEFRAAIEPVRRLGLDEFHQAWATSVDFERKVIRVEANTTQDEAVTPTTTAASLTRTPAANGKLETEPKKGEQYEVPYDKLVMAVGCYSQTFGIEGVKEHASFLRDVGDARAIRVRVLQAFETASLPTTSDEARSKLLHFAVVGGGPTGIEFAAELHDLVHDDLAKLYPPQLMKHVSITVYDIAPKVLPMFDRNLASYATDMFRRQGIKVKTEHSIQRIRRSEGRDSHLMLRIKEEAEEVGAGVVVWSTGLMQNPLVSQVLGQAVRGTNKLAKDSKTGGLITDSRLQVQLEDFRGGKETETLRSSARRKLPGHGAGGIAASRLPRQAAEQRQRWRGYGLVVAAAVQVPQLGDHGVPGLVAGHTPELGGRDQGAGGLDTVADGVPDQEHEHQEQDPHPGILGHNVDIRAGHFEILRG